MNSDRPTPAKQLPLALSKTPALDRDAFVESAGNAEAFAAIHAWRDWQGGGLALVGPEGSGKTHLATVWSDLVGARIFGFGEVVDLAFSGPVVLEDADRRADDETLFHLLNGAVARGGLLITTRTTPRDWPTDLPDLRSRLRALRVVELESPDDAVLSGLLQKFFRERNIKPDPEVLPYLLRRIERSAPTAFKVVARIDEAAYAQGREVTRAFVREVLDGMETTGDPG